MGGYNTNPGKLQGKMLKPQGKNGKQYKILRVQ
jgi:hypothetical protein